MNESYHYDSLADRLIVKRTEDVTPILEANKRQFDVDNKRHKSEAMNHVARIPTIAIEQYCKRKGLSYETFMRDEKLFRAFLNDPDNRLFRTKPGRI